MEIISFLPCFYVKDSINRRFTEEELKCVEYHATQTYKNIGNSNSIDKRVLDTQFLDIRNKIVEMLDQYTSTIICASSKNFKLKITQSWINYTESGQFHHTHSHPNSIVSGIVYFNVEDSDRIEFHSDKPQQLKIYSNSPNAFNSETWWFPIKSGDIILFPSYQRHSVPNTTSSNTRISLSFNTFVDGDVGDEDRLTHLSVRLN